MTKVFRSRRAGALSKRVFQFIAERPGLDEYGDGRDDGA